MNPQELEEYRKLIDKKERGESIEDEIPDSLKPLLQEPISSTPMKGANQMTSPIQSPISDVDEGMTLDLLRFHPSMAVSNLDPT